MKKRMPSYSQRQTFLDKSILISTYLLKYVYVSVHDLQGKGGVHRWWKGQTVDLNPKGNDLQTRISQRSKPFSNRLGYLIGRLGGFV
jgi:hypothetical protein